MNTLLVTIATALLLGLADSATNLTITNSWHGGFKASGCIPITKELRGWKGRIVFTEDVHSLEIYVAIATKVSPREYLIENESFNANLPVGDQLCISLTGYVTGIAVPTVTVHIDDMDV